MKQLLIILIVLSFFSVTAYGEGILGKWKDKSEPSSYKYEFKKGNDFIYTRTWITDGKAKSSKELGVWEIGSWTVTSPKGNESSCGLTIYAGTLECCFDFKFIANNLILTNKYKSTNYSASMCSNRVLVELEKEVKEIKLELPQNNPRKTHEHVTSGEGWKSITNWRKLTTDMRYSEVQEILGEPYQVDGGQIATWHYQNGGKVVFMEGKVYIWSEPRP